MEKSNKLFLYVDLPRFDFPVVFAEQVSPMRACFFCHLYKKYPFFHMNATLPLPPRPIPNPTLATAAPSPLPPNFLSSDPHLWRIYDPESIRIMADVNGEGNPVEAKYRRLARSHRTGRGDRELKPGPDMRDLLNVSANAFRYEFVGTERRRLTRHRTCSANHRPTSCRLRTRT
jgi:phosphatidylinositol 3-kinase